MNKERYIVLPEWLMSIKEISLAEKIILAFVLGFPDLSYSGGYEYIAQRTSISIGYVEKTIRNMKKNNLLVIRGRGNKKTISVNSDNLSEFRKKSDNLSEKNRTIYPQNSDNLSVSHIYKNNLENKLEEERVSANLLDSEKSESHKQEVLQVLKMFRSLYSNQIKKKSKKQLQQEEEIWIQSFADESPENLHSAFYEYVKRSKYYPSIAEFQEVLNLVKDVSRYEISSELQTIEPMDAKNLEELDSLIRSHFC